MASPISYGLHVISGELTDKDTNRIASAIHRFLTYKEAAQLENLKQVYDLPDGGYFIVQHLGGLFRVIADKQDPKNFKFNDDGLVKSYIPMFFSGVVEKSAVREGESVEIKLTQQSRKRIGRQLKREIPSLVKLERFTIMPNNMFSEFIPKTESVISRTQFFAHNPSWYSGSMAKAMQFVGGYGRQDFDNLPNSNIERISYLIPSKLKQQLLEKYFDVRLPGYVGLPPITGQFQYDYKWGRTHAIAFDVNNKPWLIRVGTKVYAMPLPIIPFTADLKFHEYAEETGDQELINVLSVFGALPSGESFPENSIDFQRWVRAGVIIEICDNTDFFSYQAFFTGCGWSFNNNGDSAYNTGYRYDNKGIAEAATFHLSLHLQASKVHYGTDKVSINEETDLSEDEKKQLTAYLHKFLSSLGADASLSKTIKYKIRHIPYSVILKRATNNMDSQRAIESEITYWDTYVSEPIAKHTGKITKIYTGKLFHPSPIASQPQIKFPEYGADLCVSFNFSALNVGVSAECDTIMYAYYDNDSLKVVKYFYSDKKYQQQIDTDYEEYMTVGSWYMNETYGESRISGNFYLTDIDDREDIAPTETKTKIKGEDKGYDSKPWFAYDGLFQRAGTMWRNRYYTHLTKKETIRDRSMAISVLIPMFNRNTVLYATKLTSGTKNYSEAFQLNYVADPYSYRYWTNDFVYAWVGGLEKMTGKPTPINGNPIWVEIENYSPSSENEFANNGPWVLGLPADYTWLVHPDNSVWQSAGGGGMPSVKSYSITTNSPTEDSGNVKWAINDEVVVISKKLPEPQYFLTSPDNYGFGMSRSSSRIFLGDAEYVNVSENNESNTWTYLGYTSLVNHNRAYHFIGVINE